ncbi:sialoadhesin-like isoform X2 [Channa argus]|uniref:sialoadhesin-like isoform X2 n=1 Tax=Channa argus TaxID=215402 RepID=UPI00351FA57F
MQSLTAAARTLTARKSAGKVQLSVSDLQVNVIPTKEGQTVTLMCSTSCALTETPAAYIWYKNREFLYEDWSPWYQELVYSEEGVTYSCAIKGHKDLRAPDVSVGTGDNYCWSVNYENRRICALQGSSVNISTIYSHPHNQQPTSKYWYKIRRRGEGETEVMMNAAGRVKCYDNMGRHILEIKHLQKNDSALYTFKVQRFDGKWKQSDFAGVTLVATGLRVKFSPAVVMEGECETVTCSTSCPLSGNTTYMWYLNGRLLPQSQNKHLVLDPAGTQHAGRYSWAVRNGKKDTSSREKTLIVLSVTKEQASSAEKRGLPVNLQRLKRQKTRSRSSRKQD